MYDLLMRRGQFVKLLLFIDQSFLPDLSRQADPDARAVYSRLQTYLHGQRYLTVPEGRTLAETDASSYDRA